jgi:coatomer protein complex subunit gamma
MVSKLIKTQLKSPYALCHLIRIAAQVIVEEKNHGHTSWDFIESCLKHKSEMVVFEAANAHPKSCVQNYISLSLF